MIQSKSRSSVKGSLGEPTSLQYLCYFHISYIYEIVCGWMHVYLATHYFHIYLCKCLSQLRLSERTRILKFLIQWKFQVLRQSGRLKSSYIFGYIFYKLCWIVNVSIFTSSYSHVKSICKFLNSFRLRNILCIFRLNQTKVSEPT